MNGQQSIADRICTDERLRRLESRGDKIAPALMIENLEPRLLALATGAEPADERMQRVLCRLSDRELLRIAFPERLTSRRAKFTDRYWPQAKE
jgi:hypothetical protein